MVLFQAEIFPIILHRMTKYHSALNSFPFLVLLWMTNTLKSRRHRPNWLRICHKVYAINQNRKFWPLIRQLKEYFDMPNLRGKLTLTLGISFHSLSLVKKDFSIAEYIHKVKEILNYEIFTFRYDNFT